MSSDPMTSKGIDVVDENDTVRLSLTAGDDLEGRRVASASGVVLRDRDGRERGGQAVLDLPEGTRVLSVLDHPGGDAIGMTVDDHGWARWFINDAPGEDRKPRATRMTGAVTPDGTPSIDLLDDQGRPRLRLTVIDGGAGAIEFLNGSGEVIHRSAPELGVDPA